LAISVPKVIYPLTVTLQHTAPANAFLVAATYATDAALQPNNRPLPINVIHFNDSSNQEIAQKSLDPYWMVGGQNINGDATVNLSATYRDSEWDGSNNTKDLIVEMNLKPIFWNGSKWNSPAVSINGAANLLSVSNLLLSNGIVCASDDQNAESETTTRSLKVHL
jgi:hypothetical protein